MFCNEPFIRISLLPEQNQSKLEMIYVNGWITEYSNYTIPQLVNGYETHLVTFIHGAQTLEFIVKYKIATPANSCIDDMAGTNHVLTGSIMYNYQLPIHGACGDILP
jgi:hypothetical protein